MVSEGFDSIKKDYYYRPLGGGIEYGETSRDAVSHEIREELGVEIENIRLIAVVENISFIEAIRDTKSFSFSTLNSSINRFTDSMKSAVMSKRQTCGSKRNGIRSAKPEAATGDWCRRI